MERSCVLNGTRSCVLNGTHSCSERVPAHKKFWHSLGVPAAFYFAFYLCSSNAFRVRLLLSSTVFILDNLSVLIQKLVEKAYIMCYSVYITCTVCKIMKLRTPKNQFRYWSYMYIVQVQQDLKDKWETQPSKSLLQKEAGSHNRELLQFE